MIKFHSPVIITKNIEAQKQFYTTILQQTIELDFGNCVVLKCGISLWQLRPDHIIVNKTGSTFSDNGNKNLELCFETELFDQAIESLSKFELVKLHDVIEESWGQRVIRFYDPEENLVELGETIPSFVKRLYQMGMTIEEVCQKSSVPIEMVREYIK